MTVDRDSMDPLYEQVAALILGRIRSGEWPAGTRLPSEPDLAEFYQVNRDTVRKAVRQLAAEGRLRVVRGRGTFSLGDGERPVLPRACERPRPLAPGTWQESPRLQAGEDVKPSPLSQRRRQSDSQRHPTI